MGLFKKKQVAPPSKNSVSLIRFILSLPFAFVSWYYHASVITALPELYFFIFSIVKENLEREALPAEIPIYVYDFADATFYKLFGIVVAIGLMRCIYLMIKNGSFFEGVKRIVYHGTVLNIKITLITSIIYIIPLALIGKLYVDKLWVLAEKKEYVAVGYNPFKLLLHVAQKMNLLDYTIKNIQRLQQAKILYAHINDMSALFYIAALCIALYSTVWFFYRLQRKLTS